MSSTTAPAEPASRARPNNDGGGFRQTLAKWDFKASPYLYIAPFFILFGIFGLAPLIYTAWVAVHDWHIIGGQGDFVGLDNFTAILGQAMFWKSVFNTISIFLIATIPQLLAAIFIAAALDNNLRAGTFWRMGVLLPFVAAPVAVAIIFSNLFGNEFGLINNILQSIGLDPIRWTGELSSHVAIATMVNFRWTGYNALILLAGMQAIPRDLYEAATIDGAGRMRQFFSVTIPMLRPTIIFVVITSTIGGLQVFDEAKMFGGGGGGGGGIGGADGQWKTITLFLWEVGWRQSNLGRSAAIAWLLFLLIVLIGALNFFITRRISSSGGKR
ncbi:MULTISPECIES: carbohydrate ABC transporter permease [unclassified Microbacterium]|uniref:carbohydrate ABC transporter permease n=1 Tax=unclassified Microbacterium TaxID=2609290 RepID=UPI00214B6F2F|nr:MULTISPECIES: sugar ABC transporter permease [unclassified Microbacterium]MCR2801988.1 sugar ABC transporter permease [Microbacterium sp. zg.Y818]MCR2824706.1 sugar ABC transporter permease [Microbacterium sp. zg.Y909]WIM22544.1 sugar ABC transporter permease [Microbacterium sp. zg-Y818]